MDRFKKSEKIASLCGRGSIACSLKVHNGILRSRFSCPFSLLTQLSDLFCWELSFKTFSAFTFFEIRAQNFPVQRKAFLLTTFWQYMAVQFIMSNTQYHRHPGWPYWQKQAKRSGKG